MFESFVCLPSIASSPVLIDFHHLAIVLLPWQVVHNHQHREPFIWKKKKVENRIRLNEVMPYTSTHIWMVRRKCYLFVTGCRIAIASASCVWLRLNIFCKSRIKPFWIRLLSGVQRLIRSYTYRRHSSFRVFPVFFCPRECRKRIAISSPLIVPVWPLATVEITNTKKKKKNQLQSIWPYFHNNNITKVSTTYSPSGATTLWTINLCLCFSLGSKSNGCKQTAMTINKLYDAMCKKKKEIGATQLATR